MVHHDLTPAQQRELFFDGLTVLRGAVPAHLVAAARAAIDGTGATAAAGVGKPKQEFEQINLNRFAKRAGEIAGSAAICDLFNKSAVLPTLQSAIGPEIPQAVAAQIALTLPTEPSERCMQSGWPEKDIPHRGWAGHLDGVWNGGHPAPRSPADPSFDPALWNSDRAINGCSRSYGRGVNLGNYTCLVGISLSDQSAEGSGNLGVLKGSHHAMEQFFRLQAGAGGPIGPGGPYWPREDRNAPNGRGVRHYPDMVRERFQRAATYTPDGKCWPKPTEVRLSPGDAAVVLYHCPHNATRNESPAGAARYQLYFRVTSGRRAPYKSAGDEAAAASRKTLVDLWSEWDGMQAVLPRLRAELKADGARASKLLLDVTAPAAPAKL